MPTYIEFISLVLGFAGAVLMAAPEVVEKLFRTLCCCSANNKGTSIQQSGDDAKLLKNVDEIEQE